MVNLLGLYTAGKIRPTIDSVWSFDNVSLTFATGEKLSKFERRNYHESV